MYLNLCVDNKVKEKNLFCTLSLSKPKTQNMASNMFSFRYLDYGDAEWKKQAKEVLKSLET